MSSATTTPAAVKPGARPAASFSFLNSSGTRLFTKKELVGIFRGLSSMLRAQINTADAIKYYAHGLQNKVMADSLLKIREDINAGISVHDAFRRSGRFNDMVIGLVQAGSDAGQLHKAFSALATRFTSEMRFTKALRKATVMPCVIISVLIGAFIVSQVKIVPQVEDMMKGVNAKPDGMTAIFFSIAHTTGTVWPAVVLSIIAVVTTIAVSKNVRNLLLGLAMSKWRLLRLLVMSLQQMTFLATIELLHANGINLAKAIRVSANSVKSSPFYQELRDAADKYEHTGLPLSTAFAKYTSVDSQVVHMFAIGEKSASLDTQLALLSSMYEEDADNHMATFTAVLGFLVLVIAVLLIAAVFVGTFMPIFLMGPRMMNSKM